MTIYPHQDWVDTLTPEEMQSVGENLVKRQRSAVAFAAARGLIPSFDGSRRFEVWCAVLTRDADTMLSCMKAGRVG